MIVLTTNALTVQDLERLPVGFSADTTPSADPAELLGKSFPREFLGRFDEIVPFKRLTSQDLRAILKLRLTEVEDRLARKGLRLHYAENRLLDRLLAQLGHDTSGARGIARLLERCLLQPLALALLEAESGGGKRGLSSGTRSMPREPSPWRVCRRPMAPHAGYRPAHAARAERNAQLAA